jgi:hypothetical protein
MVVSRGFEPRSARSERAASANCATSRCGDHGRIRTATEPALNLLPVPDWGAWPLVPLGGLEPPPHGLRTRNAALTLQRECSGANDGIRTRTSRLGRPVGDRYPTFALVRPPGIEPMPLRWQRGMLPPHSGRTWTGAFTGPSTSVSCQRPRSFELVGGKGFEPNRSLRENGVTTRRRTIRSVPPVWRQRQESNPDPRALEARMLPLHHAAHVT